MDSVRHFPVTTTALLVFALLAQGCASNPSPGTAPRSTLSRGNALKLAKMVAANVGGEAYIIAPTGSMRPTLDESSVVTIEHVAFARLQAGDIVIYRSAAGSAVIHRLYERHGESWFVLGDNNSSVDREPVTGENLLGRVCAIFYSAAGDRSASSRSSPPDLMAVAEVN